MNSQLRIVFAAVVCAALAAGQMTRTGYNPNIVGVPSSGTGGQAGGASNPANVAQVTANVGDSILVGHVSVLVYLSHARVGDLTMTLTHCGTSVTLFSGSVNQLASVDGTYTFDDFTLMSFPSAVNGTQGPVQPGSYQPAQSLSAFNGQNATGPWILTLADLAAGVSGAAGLMTISVTSGADFGGSFSPTVAIPDGAAGVCSSPVSHVVNVPYPGQVGIMSLTLGLNHTYTSDLTIILSHAGVSATIMAFNMPNSAANLSGSYTFDDDAMSSWYQAVAGLPSTSTVTTGSYRPLSPLAAFSGLDQAGPWYVTICDAGAGDIGVLYAMSLTIATSAWDLEILQPNGPASVTVANSGGGMGNTYANMMTLAAGSFPNGWLHGLDISLLDVAIEVSFGAPFFGTLGACGSASTTIAGPVPSGITVYMTGLELDSSGSIVNFKPAFAYTTP